MMQTTVADPGPCRHEDTWGPGGGATHLGALPALGVAGNNHHLTLEQVLHEGVLFRPDGKGLSLSQELVVPGGVRQPVEGVQFQVLTGQEALLLAVTGIQRFGEIAFFRRGVWTFQLLFLHPVAGAHAAGIPARVLPGPLVLLLHRGEG